MQVPDTQNRSSVSVITYAWVDIEGYNLDEKRLMWTQLCSFSWSSALSQATNQPMWRWL